MRNLKVLGLALMAMFAMSAMTSAVASADDFEAEKYSTALSGGNDPGTTDLFVTTSGNVSCKVATYTGSIAAPVTAITATPSYSECTAFGFPATIDVNGCQYVFNVQGGGSTSGDVDLICSGTNTITVTAISAGTVKCTVHVGTQKDIAGTVQYTEIGSGTTREVTVDVDISGIDYSHTKGTGLGACTAGSATNGTLSAKGVVTGSQSGTHVGIFLT